MLRTLSLFEKYKTNIDDIGEKRRYSRNILQWSKIDFKIMIYINGDYWDRDTGLLKLDDQINKKHITKY